MTRKEWDLAVTIGGPKKSAQQLAQLLGLAKAGKLVELEESWEREGASKNEVKRRIKAISRFQADVRDAASGAKTQTALAADSVLRCVHFGACSGCSAEAGLDDMPVHRDARAFFATLLPPRAAPFEIHMGEVHQWRTQAKLAVTAPPGKGATSIDIGLYKSNSHEVLAIPKCRVHHPSINRAAELVRQAARDLSVRPYDERTGRGELRYIQLAVERYSGKVQLTLVWNAETFKDAAPLLPRLAKKLTAEGEGLFHSIWGNLRTGGGNAILERDPLRWSLLSGPEYVNERLLNAAGAERATLSGAPLTFPMAPTMFRQANLDQVTELYGGAGLIGLSAALPQCDWLRCSDENPNNLAAFLKVKRTLLAGLREKVTYQPATAEDAIQGGLAQDAEILIVDPPRKGLQLVSRWIANESLKDDLGVILASHGGWVVAHAEGHVLFPGSDHLETLVILDRS